MQWKCIVIELRTTTVEVFSEFQSIKGVENFLDGLLKSSSPGDFLLFKDLLCSEHKSIDMGKQNAVQALLDEYHRAVHELQLTIGNIEPVQLVRIVDTETNNPECVSIQAILSHVVSSGYSYCVYIRNQKDPSAQRPQMVHRKTTQEYCNDLNDMLSYTDETFAGIYDEELEEFEVNKKMLTSWGQTYDIEQLMEHALVHILRHRRQIERFKKM